MAPIEPDAVIRSDNYINDSERDATPANDAGRVPKLEANGRLAPYFQTFLEFGDGSDGDIDFDGTNTYASFASKSGSVYTLIRDVFGATIQVQASATVKTNGFRIFASEILINDGLIHANGGDAGNGSQGGSGSAGGNAGGNGGTAGAAAHSSGSLPASLPGLAGATGGAVNSSGVASTPVPSGNTGSNQAKVLGGNGVNGGNGGNSSATAGTGGTGATATGTIYNSPRNAIGAYLMFDTQPSNTITFFYSALQSGSGGGGSGGSGYSGNTTDGPGGGGGGGSGAPGGFVVINAFVLENNGTISANGGNGGNGGAGISPADLGAFACDGSGGGGGGGGGSGGFILLVYAYKTASGTVTVNGGTKGTGGAASVGTDGGGNGSAGADGQDGNVGTIIEVEVPKA